MAATLFNDGVSIIYSYLNCTEWNSAARSCHHWFAVAGSSSTHQHALLPRWHTAHFLRAAGAAAVAAVTTSSVTTSVPFPWSLRHRLTSIQFTELTLDDILPLVHLAPHLRSLQIDSVDPQRTIQFLNSMKNQSLMFPSSLTSISILGGVLGRCLPVKFIDIFAFALSLSRCSLTHLHLSVLISLNITALTANVSLQQSLRSLHIVFTLDGHDDSITKQLMRDVSQLSSLTHLKFEHLTIRHSHLTEMQVMPFLTELFLQKLHLSPETFITLQSRTPNIHRIRGDTIRSSLKNASGYSHFMKLKEITFGPLPRQVAESEFVESLCLSPTQPPLECLRLIKRNFVQATSWYRVSDTFPSLTQLEFVNIVREVDPLVPFLTISQLTSRLQSISCKKCTLSSALFVSHASLPNMTYLSLQLGKVSGFSPRQIFDCTNSTEFMRQLTFLEIEVLGRIDLIYDTEKGVNKCIFDGDKAKVVKLDRRKVPSSNIPPVITRAPRLVGIEPNPGPTSASASASTIFDDGVRIIYSHLFTSEWNTAARISRQWFHIASSSSQYRQIHLAIRSEEDQVDSLIQRLSSSTIHIVDDWKSLFLISAKKKSKSTSSSSDLLTNLSVSPWSLRHHIVALDLSSECHLQELPYLAQLFPQLRSLKIYQLTKSDSAALISCKFPASLEEIFIQSASCDSREIGCLPAALGSVFATAFPLLSISLESLSPSFFISSLTCLHLTHVDVRTFNLATFCSRVHIQRSLLHFSIECAPNLCTKDSHPTFHQTIVRFMQHICRLQALKRLRITGLSFNEHLFYLMPLMPSLTDFETSHLRIDLTTLNALHAWAPSLERIHWQEHLLPRSHFEGYSQFVNLKEIVLGSLTDLILAPGPHALEKLCAATAHLPIECFHLNMNNMWVADNEWTRFSSIYPALTRLKFESIWSRWMQEIVMPYDVPDAVLLCRRLTHIEVRDNSVRVTSSLLTQRASDSLPNLLNLQIYNSPPRERTVTERDIFDLFNNPHFYPRLQYLRIRNHSIRSGKYLPLVVLDLEYDIVKKINWCMIDGNNKRILQLDRDKPATAPR